MTARTAAVLACVAAAVFAVLAGFLGFQIGPSFRISPARAGVTGSPFADCLADCRRRGAAQATFTPETARCACTFQLAAGAPR